MFSAGDVRSSTTRLAMSKVCSAGSWLCRFAVVVLQEATKAGAAADVAQRDQVGLLLSFLAAQLWQLVVQALMWPLGMIVFDELPAEVIHVPLAEYHEVVKAFLLDALYEPLA